MKKIGLALGGGGAKGFAHIPVLEAFDELGVRPWRIAGTSIGAIVGALYASGHTGAEIARMIDTLLVAPRKSSLKNLFRNRDSFRFLELIDPRFSLRPGGLLKGEKLLDFLYGQMGVSDFRDLGIPMQVVATDFWRCRQVVFDDGELLPAVRASMALPYLFTPVVLDGRVLVDGGLVNNVPHDLLDPKCDLRIAVDVMGESSTPKNKIPSPLESLFHTYQVMMQATTREKLARHPVDILLRPPLLDIDPLDFHKAESIYAQGVRAKEGFKRQLDALLSGRTPRRPAWWRRR